MEEPFTHCTAVLYVVAAMDTLRASLNAFESLSPDGTVTVTVAISKMFWSPLSTDCSKFLFSEGVTHFHCGTFFWLNSSRFTIFWQDSYSAKFIAGIISSLHFTISFRQFKLFRFTSREAERNLYFLLYLQNRIGTTTIDFSRYTWGCWSGAVDQRKE